MTGLETEVKDFKPEMFRKIDTLGIKFKSSQEEMAPSREPAGGNERLDAKKRAIIRDGGFLGQAVLESPHVLHELSPNKKRRQQYKPQKECTWQLCLLHRSSTKTTF